jgi:hypothetical protein
MVGVRIEIVVDDVNPVRGWVSADGQPPVAFTGWLPLMGALERLIALPEAAPQGLGGQLDP